MNTSRLVKAVAVFGFGMAAAFSYASPPLEITTSYFTSVNGSLKLVGQKTRHCNGKITTWGIQTPLSKHFTIPCK